MELTEITKKTTGTVWKVLFLAFPYIGLSTEYRNFVEYGMGSEVSTNGDVYSFGILLLEMMTRKRPIDPMFQEGLNLHNLAKTAFPDGVMEILDSSLPKTDEKAAKAMNEMVRIGVACSMESPQDRMDMSTALHELVLVRDNSP